MNYNFKYSFKRFVLNTFPEENSGTEILKRLEQFNIHTCTYDILKKLNVGLYNRTKLSMSIYQNIYMKQLKKEFVKLNQAFNNEKLQVISMKGFSIDSEVYLNNRIFTDNDYLFKDDEINKALVITERLGYRYRQGNSFVKPTIIELPIINTWFEIGLSCDSPVGLIPVELHNNLMPPKMGVEFNKEALFSRAKRKNVFGVDIYTMDMHDRIIFLVMHFLKDYRYQINWLLSGKMEHFADVRKLYDIALLLDKNKNTFNWNIFKKLTLEMDIILETRFVLKLFNYVFPNLLPKEVLMFYESTRYNSNRMMCDYIKELLDCDCRQLMVFDIEKEFRETLKSLDNRTKLVCTTSNTTFIPITKEVDIPIFITNANPKKRISNMNFATYHNDTHVFFNISYSGAGNLPEFYLKFVNPSSEIISNIIINCMIPLSGDNEGSLYIFDYVSPVQVPEAIIYNHEQCQGVSKILIGLPFNILKILSVNEKIIFNAMINNTNPGSSETHYILCGDEWDDIKQCCTLLFI